MTRARVLRLPEHVANQIAAGEVVGRPANVVKELVENALDAGARTIVVTLEGGGVGLVRVVDDGAGMTREDARAALERHATSKLRTADDLASLATLGFRGEALPSIASVSRFTLRTRTAEDEEGTELRSEGTGEVEVRPSGTAVGTTVEVRDLFFNVPARRKFLRTLATESSHVAESLRATAFAHPAVQFELWRDGRLHRRYLRASSFADRAGDLLGDDAALHLVESRGPLRIEALLSTAERARPGMGGLTILVNRRPVEDRAVARAVAAAYGDRLERGRYPSGVLELELPTSDCDVNVHPQKSEVRFAEPRAVCDAVFGAVQRAVGRREASGFPRSSGGEGVGPSLEAREPIGASRLRPAPPWTNARRDHASDERGAEAWVWTGGATGTTSTGPTPSEPQLDTAPAVRAAASVPFRSGGPDAISPLTRPTFDTAFAAAGRRTEDRSTTVLANLDGVLVVHDSRGVSFLDRRALHATVLASDARRALEGGGLETRPLVFPIRLDVASDVVALTETHASFLEELGFDLRPAGPRSVALHAVARLFGGASAEELARAALDVLPRPDREAATEEFVRRASELGAARSAPALADEALLVAAWRTRDGAGELRDADEALHHVPASDLTPRDRRK